jgi:hypothetical protein
LSRFRDLKLVSVLSRDESLLQECSSLLDRTRRADGHHGHGRLDRASADFSAIPAHHERLATLSAQSTAPASRQWFTGNNDTDGVVLAAETFGVDRMKTVRLTCASARHVREPREVQLVGHGDGRCRAVTVLAKDDVGFATAGVVTVECVGAMQKHDHIRILFE